MRKANEGNTCPVCHQTARAWEAKCARCKRTLYPYLVDKPGPEWVCSLCSLAGSGKRREAGRRNAARKSPQGGKKGV